MNLMDVILNDMRAASAAVDEAYGTSDYTARLVALALIARHFLREYDAQAEAALPPQAPSPQTDEEEQER